MSFLVAGLVLKTKTSLPASSKLVLLGLAEHARQDGSSSFPSIQTLSRYAEVSERTAQRALKGLVEASWVEVEAKATNRRPTTYRVNVAKLEAAETDELLEAVGTRPTTDSRGDKLTPQALAEVTPPSARGDTGDALGVTPVSPEPTTEPVKKSPKELLTAFDLERERRYKEKYAFAGSRDGPNAARLLKALPFEELESRIQDYVWCDDEKLIDCRHSFGMFVARVNSHGRKLSGNKRSVEKRVRRTNTREVADRGFYVPEVGT